MQCHRCGFSQPDDSVFCEKCGVKLDKPKTVICTICGHEQTDGAFCDICGNPINGVSVPEKEPVIVRPFADRWEEPKKDENKPNPKDRVSVQRKRLIAAICFVSVCIFAAGGVFLYMKGNKDKENIKTDRIARSDSSEEDQSSDTPETATTAVTTTVTTTQTETTTVKEEPATEAISEDWVDEYIEQAKLFENEAPKDAELSYRLININNDDIPELLMETNYDTSKLFTVADGHSKLLNQGETFRTNAIIYADSTYHFYLIYNMMSGDTFDYRQIQLNDDGSTEIISQFGCSQGKYYSDDNPSTKTDVDNLAQGYRTSIIQVEKYSTAAELEKVLEKYRQQGTSAKKKVEVIPATELCEMTKGELLDKIGDSYRVSWEEYSGTGGYIYGITSDEYFPNVLISMYGQDVKSPEDVKKIFDEMPNSSVIDIRSISIFEGGLIGDDVKVGDTYESMLMKIDALNGVGVYQPVSSSIIDGHSVALWFENVKEINELKSKYGTNVVDLNNTSGSKAKCVSANIMRVTGPQGGPAVITGDGVALRTAPYADAVNLWNIEKGAKVYVGGESVDALGEHWVEVGEYRTKDSRVWKKGYIHAEYVKITN